MTPPPTASSDSARPTLTLAAPSSAEPDRRGQHLGRYVVVDTLGRGGMGVVYKAFDPELDRLVALKLMQTRGHPADAAVARERLVREARALAKLSHPNVIVVHDVGVLGDDVFLALEYVDGQTLRRWQVERGRSPAEVLRAYVDAGRGLAAAHAAGLVHRDFKPDNVLISTDGRVRVLDFGLVRAGARSAGGHEGAPAAAPAAALTPPAAPEGPAGSADRPAYSAPEDPTLPEPVGALGELTAWGQPVGTLRYMAPEQFIGTNVDARSDQFSFCVALYEALYGESPFGGETADARLAARLLGRLRPPPARPGVPPTLGRVLARGLAQEPAARHESMPALLHELTRDRRSWPRRLAPILGAGLGLAVVAGAAWGAGARSRAERSALCRGLSERIDPVWNDATRSRVRTAFAASGLPYAADSLRTAEALLDRYRDGWVAARTDACEATRVRGDQSEELLDLRMQCLDGRLADLRMLSEGLASADAPAIEHAVQAAAALEPIAGCADVAALRAPLPLPSGPAARARALTLRDELAAVETAFSLGRNDEALRGAERLVAGAREVGHRPLLAEALLALSQARRQAGAIAEAERALHEAWTEAELGNHARLRPLIWARLAWFDINAHDRADSALALTELARAVVGDAPWTDPTRREVERRRLGAFFTLNRLDEAKQLADEIVREVTDDPAILHNAVLTSTVVGDFEGALSLARRELALTVEKLGAMHPETAPPLTNVGLVLQSLGRCREALAAYEAAAERSPSAAARRAQYVQLSLQGRLYLLLELGRPREALALGLERYDDLKAMDPLAFASMQLLLAQAQFALRHDAEAAVLATDVERALAGQPESTVRQRRALVELAALLLALGQTTRAEARLAAVEKNLTDGERRHAFSYPLYLATRAQLDAARGRPETARQWAEQARALLHQTSPVRFSQEAPALFALARAAPGRAEATELARQVLRGLEGAECTDPVLQRQARAWLARRPPTRRR